MQQRLLERQVALDLGGPVQQAVGVEGVVDAGALVQVEVEVHLGAERLDVLVVAGDLVGVDAVLALEMLDQVLAFRRHVGVQFERLDVQLHVHIVAQPANGGEQAVQADGAPGADHVGDEVDGEGLAHCHALPVCNPPRMGQHGRQG
ncbi:hypothetical protein D9M73_211610 [compost metagenome]